MIPGRCIQHTHKEKRHKSWCGRTAYAWQEFMFSDIDHAAYNQISGSVPVCQECIRAVVQALQDPPKHITSNAQESTCLGPKNQYPVTIKITNWKRAKPNPVDPVI